jgi:hypothetical protein
MKIELMLKWLLPLVPGCPDVMALTYYKRALREFCEQTYAYQIDLDPIQIEGGIAQYDLDVDTGFEVTTIISAFIGYERIAPLAPHQVRPTWASYPSRYVQWDGTTVTLYPTPVEDGVDPLALRVALTPLLSATDMDDGFADEYGEDIANGAAYRLMVMPKQPFTDLTGSLAYKAAFGRAISDARIEFNRGLQRGELQVEMIRP